MSRLIRILAVFAVVFMVCQVTQAEVKHRIGGGVHYWKALDDIGGDVDNNGLAPVISYQLRPASLIKFEAALEIFPENYGSEDTVYSPEVYAILGAGIYGAIGMGFPMDSAIENFYAFRVGFDLELLPFLYLDINGNYRFTKWGNWDEVKADIDTDTITLGAQARIEF